MADEWRVDPDSTIWVTDILDHNGLMVARTNGVDHQWRARQIIADHAIAEAARAYREAVRSTTGDDLDEYAARRALFAAIDDERR